MASGAVKWFDGKKGYGFISPDLGPRDVFVHMSAVEAAGLNRLQPGQRLDFELAQDGEGRLIAQGLVVRSEGAEAGEAAKPA
ncbi:cold-shock protein [Sandarakinorhabdus rubra]|uniref:cold-shock protein n=1 Tax=Sandarakinorhabdus rubra TaxID=2672568 RepID=UPI0013DC083F|nr:cold-shock protein [Sandarakinorhabdus rubra]